MIYFPDSGLVGRGPLTSSHSTISWSTGVLLGDRGDLHRHGPRLPQLMATIQACRRLIALELDDASRRMGWSASSSDWLLGRNVDLSMGTLRCSIGSERSRI